MQALDSISMGNFRDAIKTEHTKEVYERNLSYFLKHIAMKPDQFVSLDSKTQTALIDNYIATIRKQVAPNTVRSRYSPIKLFCQMNDILLNFAKFEKKLPSVETKKDRLPTAAEIKSLYDNCRVQGRTLLKLLLESGMRIEAASLLKIDDFEQLDDQIYKITAYAGTKDEYVTFCSMDTYNMVKQLLEKKKGKIFPRLGGCRAILYRGWKRANIKVDFPSNHFARKWFKTRAESSGVKSVYIEAMMGHSVGLNKNYLREEMPDMIKAYKQILPHLSLNGNGEKAKELDGVKEQLSEYKAGMDLIKPILAQLAREAQTKEFTFMSPDGKQVYKLTTEKIVKLLEGRD